MKKLICGMLLLSVLLCACGKEPEETTPITSEPTEQTAVTEVTTVPETETAAAAEDVRFRHPLTGEPLDAPFTGRAVTFSINNIVYAMPQHGIGQADVLYEIETEGGITRCLGVFTELKSIPKLGPVRSARSYFNNLTAAYDGILTHCGGSPYALRANYDASGAVLKDWEHVDAATNSGFYRDQDRLNSGYAYEHTMFTTGEKLLGRIEARKYAMTNDKPTDFGLKFGDAEYAEGKKAEKIVVEFLGDKRTTLTYNKETGLYEAEQYGKNWIDANTDKTLAFRNVIAIQTKQWHQGQHSFYELTGSGKGYFAANGRMIPITWKRADVYSPFTYELEDGSPLVLAPGRTYAPVIAMEGTVTCS